MVTYYDGFAWLLRRTSSVTLCLLTLDLKNISIMEHQCLFLDNYGKITTCWSTKKTLQEGRRSSGARTVDGPGVAN
jgi:hypothetical protein